MQERPVRLVPDRRRQPRGGRRPTDRSGFTPMIEWVAPELTGAKARDFALSLGPVVTTPDEEVPPGVDWERVVAHAAANTRLYPGDILAV